MIATEIAQKFVDRFCATIRYNVNVMDTDGIIIAARDTHRIGTYHEIAHALVVEHREAAVVDSGSTPPPGVQPGVNLTLHHRGEVVGVVGVTGNSLDVDNVAHTVRTAIEAMLDYEWEREQLEQSQDRKKLFIDALLHKDNPEAMQLASLARRCGYDPAVPRLALILEVASSASSYVYLRTLKSCGKHTKQDLSFVGSSGHITVFKTVPAGDSEIVSAVRSSVNEYCTAIDRECVAVNLEPPQRYATGSVQDSLVRYRASLRTALWSLHRSSERNAFFTDHLHDLLLHSIAPDVWHTSFDFLLTRLRSSPLINETGLESLGRTFMVLREENMSPKNAGDRLGVHRNTVVFRLNRLKALCGLDPSANWRDREVLYLFFDRLLRHSAHADWPAAINGVHFVSSAQNFST